MLIAPPVSVEIICSANALRRSSSIEVPPVSGLRVQLSPYGRPFGLDDRVVGGVSNSPVAAWCLGPADALGACSQPFDSAPGRGVARVGLGGHPQRAPHTARLGP